MLDTQPRPNAPNGSRPPRDRAPAVAETNGSSPPVQPVDRSHLLRRTHRTLYFIDEHEERDGIRIRRERRVNAPFSGIPSLARNGRR